jgi:hypothetical protein
MHTPAASLPQTPIRQLIAELAEAEDALRECRASGAADRRDAVIRRQATLVRELRRRRSARH